MLKKSVHGFFNYVLAGWDSARPHKLPDFTTLAIGQSIRGLPGHPPAGWVGAFFNTLLMRGLLLMERRRDNRRRALLLCHGAVALEDAALADYEVRGTHLADDLARGLELHPLGGHYQPVQDHRRGAYP